MRLSFAFAISLTTITATHAAAPAELVGDWEVTAVAVDDSGIQALVKDDPAYMGAVLSIGEESLVWTKGTDTRPIDPAIDDCAEGANFALMDGAYTVACGTGAWGPGDGAVITLLGEDEITVDWYDGGLLTLTRSEKDK